MKKSHFIVLFAVFITTIIAGVSCNTPKEEKCIGSVGNRIYSLVDTTKDGHIVLIYTYYQNAISSLHIPESCPKCKELKRE